MTTTCTETPRVTATLTIYRQHVVIKMTIGDREIATIYSANVHRIDHDDGSIHLGVCYGMVQSDLTVDEVVTDLEWTVNHCGKTTVRSIYPSDRREN